MLLSVGDRVREGDYHVHSRFTRVVNFTDGNRVVSVVDEETGGGPINVVLRGVSPGDTLLMGETLRVSEGHITCGSLDIPYERAVRYESELQLEEWDPELFERNLGYFEFLLTTKSHLASLAFLLDPARAEGLESAFDRAFACRMNEGLKEMFEGDLRAGVQKIKGCGIGLTPSGDDFLAGMLMALNFLQHTGLGDYEKIIAAVHEEAIGENFFSNTSLCLARHGLLFERMRNLVYALLYGGRLAVYACTQRLFAVGESSGADLGTGFLLTVRRGHELLHWRDVAK